MLPQLQDMCNPDCSREKLGHGFPPCVIQLAFLVSSYNRSNIDGHTIRLHQTHYSAAPFVWHLCTFDRVTFHGHVRYWVLEFDVSTIVVCGRQNKYII